MPYPQEYELFSDNLMEPIFHAFSIHAYDIALALIRGGANIDITNYSWQYPLHLAIACRHKELVDEILLPNISLEQRDSSGKTPCILAAQLGHVKILTKLLDCNAQINTQDADGRMALMYAIQKFSSK